VVLLIVGTSYISSRS